MYFPRESSLKFFLFGAFKRAFFKSRIDLPVYFHPNARTERLSRRTGRFKPNDNE